MTSAFAGPAGPQVAPQPDVAPPSTEPASSVQAASTAAAGPARTTGKPGADTAPVGAAQVAASVVDKLGGAAAADAVPAATLKAMQMRARSEQTMFLAQAGQLADRLAPQQVLAATSTPIAAIGNEAADDVVETMVKPAVMGAAVTKLTDTEGAGEKVKKLFKSGRMDDLGKAAAKPLVQARLDALAALEPSRSDAALDKLSGADKLAKLAEMMEKLDNGEALPDELKGARDYQSPEAKARARRARAALGGKDGKPSKAAMLQAGRQLTRDLIDARLRELVEGDSQLSAFYTHTKLPIAAETTTALRARTDVIAGLSAQMSDQLRDWSRAVVNLAAEVEGGGALPEKALNERMGALTELTASTREMLDGFDGNLNELVTDDPSLQRVATDTAAAAAERHQAISIKGIRSYIAANSEKYVKQRKAVDDQVEKDLTVIGSGAALTAVQSQVVDKAKAEINSAADGATSRFKNVGKAIDAALPGGKGAEAGSSTAMDLTIQIPVTAFPGAFLGVRLHLDAERSFVKGQQTSVNAEIGLQAGGKLPLAAKALVELGGYFKGNGKTAAEAMEFISYALFRRFRESSLVPREVTNSIWGASGLTATGDETSGQAKHAEANAWGQGMEERLAADRNASAETGGYVAARGEIGQSKAGLGPVGIGAKASVSGQFGTKYSADTVENSHGQGKGAMVSGRGAESSVGQGRRSVVVSTDITAAGFGGSGTGSASWGADSATGKYSFDSLDISVSGLGKAPASALLSGDKNMALTIGNWSTSLLKKIKSLVLKMQEKEKTEIDSKFSKLDRSKAMASVAPLAYKIDEGTGAANIQKGWYEAVTKHSTTGSGSGSGSGSDSMLGTAATTAKDGARTGIKKGVEGAGAVVDGAKSSLKAAKSATGLKTQGSVNINGRYKLERSGDKTEHTLTFSLGSQSDISAEIDVVSVTMSRIENLVTIVLLPDVKVLL
ncbi:MAG: hypothetical protein QOD87_1884 [Pseudonocardiales bacterium]|nr:hypothetical protein [Pseudonocardiales bacterium]